MADNNGDGDVNNFDNINDINLPEDENIPLPQPNLDGDEENPFLLPPDHELFAPI